MQRHRLPPAFKIARHQDETGIVVPLGEFPIESRKGDIGERIIFVKDRTQLIQNARGVTDKGRDAGFVVDFIYGAWPMNGFIAQGPRITLEASRPDFTKTCAE